MLARAALLAFIVVGCQSRAPSPAPVPETPLPPAVAEPALAAEAPATPRAVEGELALAPAGTVLFADLGRTAPILTVGGSTPKRDQLPLVMRVKSVVGEVAVVSPVPGDQHCGAGLGLRWAQLELAVAVKDLGLVTRREVTLDFDDGTRLVLSAGVHMPTGTDPRVALRASFGGKVIRIPAAAPRDAVGRSYADHVPPPGATGSGSIRSGAKVRLAGEAITLPVDRPVPTATAVADGLKIEFGGPCYHATVIAAKDDVIPPAANELGKPANVWGGLMGTEIGDAYGVGGLGLVGSGRRDGQVYYEVTEDQVVYWANGQDAGRTTRRHTFHDEPQKIEERSCFAPRDRASWYASDVRLCFEPDVVTRRVTPGLGGLGLVGTGRGGGGTGEGTIGLGNVGGIGRGTGSSGGLGLGKRPSVRQAKAQVTGALDKDIIRRIVRAHLNEVRFCYNQRLRKDPDLSGRVAIRFQIGANGNVASATVKSDTTGNKALGTCIAKRVKQWKFPKPQGGKVKVVYPFVFSPG